MKMKTHCYGKSKRRKRVRGGEVSFLTRGENFRGDRDSVGPQDISSLRWCFHFYCADLLYSRVTTRESWNMSEINHGHYLHFTMELKDNVKYGIIFVSLLINQQYIFNKKKSNQGKVIQNAFEHYFSVIEKGVFDRSVRCFFIWSNIFDWSGVDFYLCHIMGRTFVLSWFNQKESFFKQTVTRFWKKNKNISSYDLFFN